MTKLVSVDGLTLFATCKTSSPEVKLQANFPAGIDMSWSYIRQAGTAENNWVSTVNGIAQTGYTVFDETDASDAYGTGQLIYYNGQQEVTVSFAYTALSYNCRVHGAAVPAG